MVDYEAVKDWGLPLAGAGIFGYAIWEASQRYPKYLAIAAGVGTGLVLNERVD